VLSEAGSNWHQRPLAPDHSAAIQGGSETRSLLKLSGGPAGEELLKGTPMIAEVLPLASSATGSNMVSPGRSATAPAVAS